MTDINNNMGADKLGKLHNINFEGKRNNAKKAVGKNYTEKEIKNLDNAHSALVGRSMIKKVAVNDVPNFDGQLVENVKDDLAELASNTKLIQKANAVFEAALAKGYSYEKATAMAREFVDFHK